MAYANLISETYAKDNSPLNSAVDAQDLKPFIKIAQEKHIQNILGGCLYEDLMDKVIASKASPPTPLTANDLTLILKVRECLVWWVLYEAIPFISTKLRNIGIVKQNGDNLETADQSTVTYLRKEVEGNALHYAKLLNDYLCQYSTLYADYNCPALEKMQPNHRVTNSFGLVVDEVNPDWKYIKKWFNS